MPTLTGSIIHKTNIIMLNNRTLNIIAKAALTVAFAVAVFLFFAYKYKYHVQYHEQYQLFLFTADYAVQLLTLPGGFAQYVSRFLVQFFYVPLWGATILAVLLAALQLLSWCIMKAHSLAWYATSFVPAILIWMFLCDENAMPAACIALIITIALALATVHIKSTTIRWVLSGLIVPISYYLVGPIGLVYALLVALYSTAMVPGLTAKVLSPIILILEALACPLIAQFIFPYPLSRLFYGIGYFRYPFVMPGIVWIAALMPVVLVAFTIFKPYTPNPSKYSKKSILIDVLAIAAIVFAAVWGIRLSCDFDKEEVFGYDNLSRNRNWNQIIANALQKTPDKPMSVEALNLALAKLGQMGDHMFRFYQNGTQGLIPPFERDLTMPLLTAEVLYNLGMVNSAQRYVFEAQESVPDFQKSARCYKRLAETNLINGDYEAAKKYLKALQHTLLYDDWASNTLQLLHDEDAINNHPEYGPIRRLRVEKDNFFSENEMDSMLGLLFTSSGQNKMAFEYLLAWSLLNRDLNRFYECYRLGKDLGYDHIPASYQEALAMIWTRDHNSWEGLSFSLSPQVMRNMESFIIDQKQNLPADIMKQKYANTYWSYYFY